MTRSGPQRYPGASTASWFQSAYPGDAMEVNVVGWHSTEGRTLPTYSGGSMAPNLTAVPDFAAKKLTWFQHFDIDVSSRAFVNAAGGVETNTLNVCQVEIVGTCDPATHEKWRAAGYSHLFMPELPDWAIRDLAAFVRWMHDNHNVPLTSDVTWKAYPGSYGTSNGVRMSASKWTNFTGHCGHQHVPENLHGDPGLLPMAAILTAAKGGTTPEDDMPTADEIAAAVVTKLIAGGGVLENSDVDRVYDRLFKRDDVLAAPVDAADYATNKFWTFQTHVQDQTNKARATLALVTAQKATIDELVKAVATLAAGVGNLDPAAIVRELTAAIESIHINLDVPDGA